jgi:RNA polymerase sigma-70 factor (ECF subfamily)
MAENSAGGGTRPTLLWRIRDPRDAQSWEDFVTVYTPLVYGHCRRRGLQPADAEDVTQEVFIQVRRSIEDFDYKPERGRFRDWLGQVTRHKIFRFLRARQATGPVVPADHDAREATEQEPQWAEDFSRHVLNIALERIRPHFKEATFRAFECTWLKGRPADEVAREMGKSIKLVYVAKSRVLRRLEEEVRELAEGLDLPGD